MSFGTLDRAHEDLDECFLLHQECLIVGAFDLARELLIAYRAMLSVHMAHEEERVLPIYARAVEKRWPEELFTGQHEKILRLLDRIDATLTPLEGGPGWRRRVIELFEVEATLKHLLEHHHLAENQALFPTADDHASAKERSNLLSTCEAEWLDALSAQSALLERGRRHLGSE